MRNHELSNHSTHVKFKIYTMFYQNLTYNANMINNVITINTVVEGFNLNISLSNKNAFGFIFGPRRLIAIITIIVNRNDNPMQIWKGISNTPFELA